MRALIFTLVYFSIVFLLLEQEFNDGVFGVFVGAFILKFISYVSSYVSTTQRFKTNENIIMQGDYYYQVFDSFFTLKIVRDEDVALIEKIDFNQIEKIYDYGNYLILGYMNRAYILKKSDLLPNSVFFALCSILPKKVEYKSLKGGLNFTSIFLFVFSLCSILFALMGCAALSEINGLFIENMWVFYVFLPVPIASLVFGFCLKRKGYKYKKNVIVGIIVSIILFVYGSFVFSVCPIL